MNTVPRYDPLMFGEVALKLRTYRHELLGANLVNADTPNFKAQDIDFASALSVGKITSSLWLTTSLT